MKQFESLQGDELLWAYNLLDCVYTRECGEVEQKSLDAMGLSEVDAFQQKLFYPVLHAMIRGVKIDLEARSKMSAELQREREKREEFFLRVLGHPLNPASPLQMKKLFFEDLKLPVTYTRAKKGAPPRPTLDDEALSKLGTKEPLVRPLIKAIQEYRSLGVFRSTFVEAPLDEDSRMRCSYNICGTETFRLNSSKNAFDTGTNLQNVPKGTDSKDPSELSLPNVRTIFVPDEGFTFFDMDLDRADLQVVIWEADDAEMKAMLREGVDMHSENAKILGCSRQMAKIFIHGTNYGGSGRTMAINCGLTVHIAEKMQSRWFQAHPGIHLWHRRTENELKTQRFVQNILGYRRYYLGRVDAILPEALAWKPQSTVACVINRAWVKIYETLPTVQVLLQVHDSLAGQFPTSARETLLPAMKEAAKIPLPYVDPLIISVGIKTSTSSWGDCE